MSCLPARFSFYGWIASNTVSRDEVSPAEAGNWEWPMPFWDHGVFGWMTEFLKTETALAVMPFLSFAFSWWLTRLARRYALRRDMIDRPNSRSSHAAPTPRGGGIAIAVVLLSFFFWLHCQESFSPGLLLALAGGGGVALVGFLDDRGGVPVAWRLLVHFCASAWALVWLGKTPVLALGGAVSVGPVWETGLALFFVVWLINLYNFMDGIDGLAGAEAISVALGALMILRMTGNGGGSNLALLILAGAAAGFLVWNWPPARIFMGDVGSGFLGFILAVFSLYVPAQSKMSLWSWLILLGVFLVDATVTLLVRALRGQQLHVAHRSHAYQQLARRWRSHQKVTLGVVAVNVLWLFPLAMAATWYPGQGAWLTGAALAPLVGVSLWAGAGQEG
ncbi:MAG: glycosyltransferase family 4 protein [Thermodesulfobacteriota bacterium]